MKQKQTKILEEKYALLGGLERQQDQVQNEPQGEHIDSLSALDGDNCVTLNNQCLETITTTGANHLRQLSNPHHVTTDLDFEDADMMRLLMRHSDARTKVQ